MKKILIFILLISCSCIAGPFDNWNYKQKIDFSGYNKAETLAQFQVLVIFRTNTTGFSYSQFADTVPTDLRFTCTNDVELNYEVDTWNPNGTSYVWVTVCDMSSNSSIYAYWGKSGQTNPPCTTNGATWAPVHRGVWHMNQSSVLDSSSNTNNGTAVNTPNPVQGIIGTALNFDSAASQYINFGNGLSMGTNGATLSIWLRSTAINGGLIGKSSARGWLGRYIIGFEDPNIFSVFDTGRPEESFNPTILNTCNDGAWHLLSTTYNRMNFESIYVDGILKTTMNISSEAATNMVSSDPFYIAAYGDATGAGPLAGFYYKGDFDEARVSSVAHSSNWVWASWMNQASNLTFNSYGYVEPQIPVWFIKNTANSFVKSNSIFQKALVKTIVP